MTGGSNGGEGCSGGGCDGMIIILPLFAGPGMNCEVINGGMEDFSFGF